MSRKLLLFAFLIIVVGLAAYAYPKLKNRFSSQLPSLPAGRIVSLFSTPTPSREVKDVPYKVEEFTTNLKIPWTFVFTSPNRILVTEREGDIRAIVDGKLLDKPIGTFSETVHSGEDGLLGLALDPDYSTNKFVYVVVSYAKSSNTFEKIVRLKDLGDSIIEDKTIFDGIPAAQFHDGGTIKFGPDNKLYISTGDALNKDNAQKLDSLSGKILRINADGTIPSDNPYPNSPVWTYGHRNSEGFDWYPESHVMMETEHGPSTFDGPPGGDEVNVIEPSNNYGWPIAHHDIHKDGMIDPKIVFTPAVAPGSGVFYTGKVFPQFKSNFFFGGLVGQGIFRVVVNSSSPSQIVSYEKLSNVDVGRVRDIVTGPDGYIYFATSNRDGRGTPKNGDDKIYRLVPQSKK